VLGSPAAGGGRIPANTTLAFLGACAALSGATAALILTGHRFAAGTTAMAGAICLLWGTISARAGGTSPGIFAESILDRVFDVCVLAPMAWVSRSGAPRLTALALIGLGAAYVASYERAKAGSLKYRSSEGLAYRAVRSFLLVMGLVTGWIEAALWAFTGLAAVAVAVRAWNVAVQEGRGRIRPAGLPGGR
jgi:phosphatidylglycerophosphate synthase